MRVKAIQSFKLRGEVVNLGSYLDVPEAALEKLSGKVEPVEPLTTDQLQYEYSTLLRRFREIDTDFSVPADESRRIRDRLAELFQVLRQKGFNTDNLDNGVCRSP